MTHVEKVAYGAQAAGLALMLTAIVIAPEPVRDPSLSVLQLIESP